ncbi:hypothetical protein BUALT_Bualt06G0141000 [Buddleja alternifolia]|uniref:F-box domain-containing protein n=1 Tax=Buddleja alternifolia TaxID=168488 RepID=A0AAV6XQZ2_9LAMI|nr:hypothetical protein BUALT_Bualt06G0141000 [Buddleja alternifolia]
MITDNEDVLTEILLWLPVISLIRFKLVCKRWFSLISSHHFSHLHTLHHHRHYRSKPEPSSLLLRLIETSNYFNLQGKNWVPYHFSPTLVDPTICSFSNGLFLLRCLNTENNPENCYIYNPKTKQSRNILLNINERYKCVMGLNLAFDPLKSPYYKIICIRATRRRSSVFLRGWWQCCQIEVYESETSTWKLCGEPFFAPHDVRFDQGIYWNDAIHWSGIFFDFHNYFVGKHPEVVLPGPNLANLFDNNYIESNGYLHCVAHSPEQKSISVFELQRDYSEWLLKYQINLDDASVPLSVLSIIRRDSDEDSMLVAHQPGKIMVYKFQDSSFEELIDLTEEAFYQEGCIQFSSRCTFHITKTLAPA